MKMNNMDAKVFLFSLYIRSSRSVPSSHTHDHLLGSSDLVTLIMCSKLQ